MAGGIMDPGGDLTKAGMAAPAKPLGTDVFGAQGYQFREAGAASRSVDQKTGTASGQLDSILAKDGVHMQRARSNALAMASDMGLRNSSIAVGNAQGALIDKATPIAQTDANIYDGASRDNQQAANAASLANANNYNQLGGIMVQERGQDNRLGRTQAFTAEQSGLDRALRVGESALDRSATKDGQAQQQAWQGGQNQIDRAWQTGEKTLDRAQTSTLQREQQTFQATQAAQDRTLQTDLQSGRITADSVQQQLSRDQQLRIQQLQEGGMDVRQASQIAAQERQQREQNVFARTQQAQQQQFQAGQSNMDRTLQSDLQSGRITADSVQQQLSRDQQSRMQQLQEGGMDSRQASNIAAQERQQREQNVFTSGQNDKNNTHQSVMFDKQATQQEKAAMTNHENTLKQMGYSSDLSKAQLPAAYAARIGENTVADLNKIATDPNLSPEAKKTATDNIMAVERAAAALGEAIYKVKIPVLERPTSTTAPLEPSGTYVRAPNGGDDAFTPQVNPGMTGSPNVGRGGIMEPPDGYRNYGGWTNPRERAEANR